MKEVLNQRELLCLQHGMLLERLVPGDPNRSNEPALAIISPALNNNNENSLLIMSEILSFKLDADLVVLSVCNTAAAENKRAEAVSGLGRTFFYAGTRALLVSNWLVHSGATSEIIFQMFRRNGILTRGCQITIVESKRYVCLEK